MAVARNKHLTILRNSVGWVVSSCVPANSGMFSSCIGWRNGIAFGLGEGGTGVLVGGGGRFGCVGSAKENCYGQYSKPVLAFGTERVKEYDNKDFQLR